MCKVLAQKIALISQAAEREKTTSLCWARFLNPINYEFLLSSALLLYIPQPKEFLTWKIGISVLFWFDDDVVTFLKIIPSLIISDSDDVVPWSDEIMAQIHTEKRRKTSLVIDELGPQTLFVLLVSDDPESNRSRASYSSHYCLLGRTR